ncbi:hypothetical protein LCGC14_1560530, partial [marine sediment metagenome]
MGDYLDSRAYGRVWIPTEDGFGKMSNLLAELIDEARGVTAKMEPELNSLSNGDNFRVCTKLKSI